MFGSKTGISLLALAVALGLSGCFQRQRDSAGLALGAALSRPGALQAEALYDAPAPRLGIRLAAAAAPRHAELAWLESAGEGSRLMSRRLIEKTWMPPMPAIETQAPALLTDAALDGEGRLHVLFLSRQNHRQRVFHAGRTAQGWSAPQELMTGNLSAYAPRMAIDSRGRLHTAWYVAQEHNAGVFYRQRTGDTWQPLEQVAPPSRDATYWAPSLAVGPDDSVHLVYFALTQHGTAVLYTRRDAGRWSPAELISVGQKFATGPVVAVDLQGRPHVVWIGGPQSQLLCYGSRHDGHWDSPAIVSYRSSTPRDPSLVVDQGGTVYITWSEQSEEARHQNFLARGRDGTWSPAVTLSQSPGNASAVTMTIVDDTLHLSWEEQTGAQRTQIRWLPINLSELAADEH